MTNPRDIVEELRRARVKSGMAQIDLAEASGYGRVTIAKYESGSHQPEHLHMLCNWAEALGYDLALVKK